MYWYKDYILYKVCYLCKCCNIGKDCRDIKSAPNSCTFICNTYKILLTKTKQKGAIVLFV